MRASGVLISFTVLTGPAVRGSLEGVGCVLSGFLSSCAVTAVRLATYQLTILYHSLPCTHTPLTHSVA